MNGKYIMLWFDVCSSVRTFSSVISDSGTPAGASCT